MQILGGPLHGCVFCKNDPFSTERNNMRFCGVYTETVCSLLLVWTAKKQ